jgi:GH24 family phage-related lysozyme (muramidase)
MTSKTLNKTAAASEDQNSPNQNLPIQSLPIVEPQRGACVEFVKFCKEQHLNSRAANTFLRVLHNQTWEAERDQIRDSMRPEVERIFAPAEKAMNAGANCKEVLAVLVRSLKEAEDL